MRSGKFCDALEKTVKSGKNGDFLFYLTINRCLESDYLDSMPRHARLDMPRRVAACHCPEIEQRDIFIDDEDRGSFLVRFSGLLTDTETKCYA